MKNLQKIIYIGIVLIIVAIPLYFILDYLNIGGVILEFCLNIFYTVAQFLIKISWVIILLFLFYYFGYLQDKQNAQKFFRKIIQGIKTKEGIKAGMIFILKKYKFYFSMKGRIDRGEYWSNMGFTFFLAILIMFVYPISSLGAGTFFEFIIMSLLPLIPIVWISICRDIKRLHDFDKSGKYLLLIFIPIVGAILLLFLLFKEGTNGPNKYGDPKRFSENY